MKIGDAFKFTAKPLGNRNGGFAEQINYLTSDRY